jgi:hypothetical protein
MTHSRSDPKTYSVRLTVTPVTCQRGLRRVHSQGPDPVAGCSQIRPMPRRRTRLSQNSADCSTSFAARGLGHSARRHPLADTIGHVDT